MNAGVISSNGSASSGSLLVVLMLFAGGCSNPDRESLAQLFQQIEIEVTGKVRPQITNPTGQQRSITFFRDQASDAYGVADTFLKSGARLTDGAREDVVRWRDAERRVYEHYDDFIQRQHFELSDDEQREGKELLDAALSEVQKLAERLEGKS